MLYRGGSKAAATSKMECFVIIVNGFRLPAVNYYHKALHIGCCSSPRSASALVAKRNHVLLTFSFSLSSQLHAYYKYMYKETIDSFVQDTIGNLKFYFIYIYVYIYINIIFERNILYIYSQYSQIYIPYRLKIMVMHLQFFSFSFDIIQKPAN